MYLFADEVTATYDMEVPAGDSDQQVNKVRYIYCPLNNPSLEADMQFWTDKSYLLKQNTLIHGLLYKGYRKTELDWLLTYGFPSQRVGNVELWSFIFVSLICRDLRQHTFYVASL